MNPVRFTQTFRGFVMPGGGPIPLRWTRLIAVGSPNRGRALGAHWTPASLGAAPTPRLPAPPNAFALDLGGASHDSVPSFSVDTVGEPFQLIRIVLISDDG